MTKSDHEVGKVIVSRPVAPLHPSEVEFEAFLAAQARRWRKPAATGPTTPASGSIRRAPPAAPRAPCIRTPTPTGPAELYGKGVLGLPKRRVLLGRQAVLRLRPGQRADLPDERGRHHLLMAERPTPDATFKRWKAAPGRRRQAHGVLRRTHRLCRHAGHPAAARARARWPCAWCRRPARRCRPNWASASRPLRRRHRRRHRLHRDAAHLPVQPPDQVRYGTTGWPVPGYEIELRGEDGGPVPDGEPGDLYIQGPSAP
jgi:benzoate-CoA ligase